MSLAGSPTKRQQVIDAITDNVKTGKLVPGTRLSSVRDMSGHFDVSLSVIQGAIKELIDEGLIESRGSGGFYVKENIPEKKALKTRAKSKGPIIFTCHHHSDLLWRRTDLEYRKIRKKQIDTLLSYFKKHPEFHIFFDQASVLKTFMEDAPEKIEELKSLVKSGGIELTGGMNIPDLNLSAGESLLRNLISGRKFYKDTFEILPQIASMSDAFGMCAQLPQVLRKAGYCYLLPGRMTKASDGTNLGEAFVWNGLDGTGITVTPFSGFVICHGYECNVPVQYPHHIKTAESIADLKKLKGNAMGALMTEEFLIREEIFWILEEANRLGGRLIEFGRIQDFCKKIEPEGLPELNGEFNPVFTGCYTTRIGVKQKVRKAENMLKSSEFISACSGKKFDSAFLWDELILTQFHDSLCGCHTDQVADIVTEKLDKIISSCDSFNRKICSGIPGGDVKIIATSNVKGPTLVSCNIPEGSSIDGAESQRDGENTFFVADLAPNGISFLNVTDVPATQPVTVRNPEKYSFSTDFFDVTFSDSEPVVKSRNLPHNIFKEEGFGEILFRGDYGSMWTEALSSPYHGKEFQSAEVTEVIDGDVFVKVTIEGHNISGGEEPGNIGEFWPGFDGFSFKKEYIFPKKLDYFQMRLKLDWKGANTKLSVRFPVNVNNSEASATYSVPFGSIVRKPYYEIPYEHKECAEFLASEDYSKAKGDWPALNWVDYSDSRGGLAIANDGTPGHQLTAGDIIISLLRSPTRRADGAMVPQEGALENGTHEYNFLFRAHIPGETGKAVELGEILNQPPVTVFDSAKDKIEPSNSSLIYWHQNNVALSSLHPGKNGTIILRLFESTGKCSKVKLFSDICGFELKETDVHGNELRSLPGNEFELKPFEIKTLGINFDEQNYRRIF